MPQFCEFTFEIIVAQMCRLGGSIISSPFSTSSGMGAFCSSVNAAKPYFLSVSKNFWMSSSGDMG